MAIKTHRDRENNPEQSHPGWLCFCLSALSLMAGFVSGSVMAQSTVETPYAVEQLAPGVYVHYGVHEEMNAKNQGDIANSGFIIGEAAVAVIDPGGSVARARLLLEAIKQRTALPVRYVVLTHIHPDHVAGLGAFDSSVIRVVHANYPRALAQRGDFYVQRFAEFYGQEREELLRAPQLIVEQAQWLDLGGRALLIEAYPTGHTDNDLTVFDQKSRTLFASDLIFAQRTPSLDGSLPGWLNVLSRMESLYGKETVIVPGHGLAGDWESTAGPQLQYLDALQQRVKELIARGDTLAEATRDTTISVSGSEWELFESVHPTNVTKAYTELEWE